MALSFSPFSCGQKVTISPASLTDPGRPSMLVSQKPQQMQLLPTLMGKVPAADPIPVARGRDMLTQPGPPKAGKGGH